MTYRGDWIIYCDICGKKCYASETTKLSNYTGRGGLIVCHQDADKIDAGLVPYNIKKENSIQNIRVNHTNTTISSPYMDLEEMAYSYYLVASQDNAILQPSQNENIALTVTEQI